MILTTSYYENALWAYIGRCSEPLRSMLSIETGHSNRLVISDDDWNTFHVDDQISIEAEAIGFADGWEAREEQ